MHIANFDMLDLSKNFFELFALPVSYTIDNSALRERYRELQRSVHPDRYANASQQEQRLAMQGSTFINEAFETLSDPLGRAQYMLRLHGVDIDSDNETTKDTAFLMEQLELREALSEIRHQADPLGAIADFLDTVTGKLNRMISDMATDFENPSPDRLDAIRERVRKMQFLRKLHQEAESLEAELEEELL
jgi:molecular chaperone HscB